MNEKTIKEKDSDLMNKIKQQDMEYVSLIKTAPPLKNKTSMVSFIKKLQQFHKKLSK